MFQLTELDSTTIIALGSLLTWREFFATVSIFRFWEFACIFLQLLDFLISRKSTLKGQDIRFINKICSNFFYLLDTETFMKAVAGHFWTKGLKLVQILLMAALSVVTSSRNEQKNEIKVEICKKRPWFINLLSPSRDLGIGLVWDNHPPDRTPLFGPTVEILFKLN